MAGRRRVGKVLNFFFGSGVLSLTVAGALIYQTIKNSPYCDTSLDTHNKHRLPPTAQVEPIERGRNFAVIVTGNNGIDYDPRDSARTAAEAQELTFLINTATAYHSLRTAGLKERNIHLFASAPKSTLPHQQTKKQAIIETLEELAKKSKPNDTLFFYYHGHGNLDGTRTPYLALSDTKETIYPLELTASLRNSKFNHITLFFGCCYGGDMASAASGNNRITISQGAEGKVGHSQLSVDRLESTFEMNFFYAMTGHNHQGKKSNADRNNDGKTTIEEMFDYGVEQSNYTIWNRIRGRWNLVKGKTKLNPFLYLQSGERPQLFSQNANPAEISFPEEKPDNWCRRVYEKVKRAFR